MITRRHSQSIVPFVLAALITACGGLSETSSPPETGASEVDVTAPETGANEVDSTTPPTADLAGIPAEFATGATAYSTWCAECHGERGEGTDLGPPHVHKVYEPGHHPDESFYNAAKIGVLAHHWPFGDMEPVEGVTDEEMEAIVAYVRWMQREAGIY